MQPPQLKDLSSSTIGEIGRLLAAAEMLKQGIAVSRPEVDIGFDLVSHYKGQSRLVQVKCRAGRNAPSKANRSGSSFQMSNGVGSKAGTERYREIGVDAFVFVRLIDTADFWVVPTSELKSVMTFALRDDSEWRDAWHVLTGENPSAA